MQQPRQSINRNSSTPTDESTASWDSTICSICCILPNLFNGGGTPLRKISKKQHSNHSNSNFSDHNSANRTNSTSKNYDGATLSSSDNWQTPSSDNIHSSPRTTSQLDKFPRANHMFQSLGVELEPNSYLFGDPANDDGLLTRGMVHLQKLESACELSLKQAVTTKNSAEMNLLNDDYTELISATTKAASISLVQSEVLQLQGRVDEALAAVLYAIKQIEACTVTLGLHQAPELVMMRISDLSLHWYTTRNLDTDGLPTPPPTDLCPILGDAASAGQVTSIAVLSKGMQMLLVLLAACQRRLGYVSVFLSSFFLSFDNAQSQFALLVRSIPCRSLYQTLNKIAHAKLPIQVYIAIMRYLPLDLCAEERRQNMSSAYCLLAAVLDALGHLEDASMYDSMAREMIIRNE